MAPSRNGPAIGRDRLFDPSDPFSISISQGRFAPADRDEREKKLKQRVLESPTKKNHRRAYVQRRSRLFDTFLKVVAQRRRQRDWRISVRACLPLFRARALRAGRWHGSRRWSSRRVLETDIGGHLSKLPAAADGHDASTLSSTLSSLSVRVVFGCGAVRGQKRSLYPPDPTMESPGKTSIWDGEMGKNFFPPKKGGMGETVREVESSNFTVGRTRRGEGAGWKRAGRRQN